MQPAVSNLMEECPTCGSRLSHVKYAEIQAKARAEDERRIRHAKAEAQKLILEEQKKLAEDREGLEAKAKVAQEALEKVNAEKAALEKQTKEAIEQAIAKAEQKKERELAQKHEGELAKVRELDRTENDKKLIKERTDYLREKDALLKTIEGLKRRVEAKTPNQLGEGAEIDLFEQLKAEFDSKGDTIKRVPKGQPGADLIHEVTYKKVVCGKILIDSKNRQAWREGYTTKLRDDMLSEKSDYAVLAAVVFPKDEKELCLKDNVVVVHPARTVALVRILRQALVRMHQQKLSDDQRHEKKSRLYEFITSDHFRQKFSEAGKFTGVLLDIDVEETTAHKKVWMKRGNTLKNMERVLGDLDEGINDILDGSANG